MSLLSLIATFKDHVVSFSIVQSLNIVNLFGFMMYNCKFFCRIFQKS